MDAKLTIDDLVRLENVFVNNGWKAKFESNEVFEIIGDMLASFSEHEKELLFDLCDRYLWISMPEYMEHLLLTLDQISDERLQKIKTINLFPVTKLKDASKVKSAVALIYNFRSAHFGGKKFKNIEFKILDTLNALSSRNFGDDELLFLVDDFIGTGQTLAEILDFSLKNTTLNLSKIIIITLVIQEATVNNLRRSGKEIYFFHAVNKGISDNYSGETLTEKMYIMDSLEELIPNIENYKFGFDRSEALVTMNRTPNNTFPIFWKTHRRGGKYIKAPFPRFHER